MAIILAARLGGSGSYVQGPGGTTKLNWINTSMTVAAWIRPDTDYVSQSGWQWSLGRTNLWRLGFVGGNVRFEVKDTNGGLHAAQAAYALYAGRWVHLAATMTSGATWTNLSAYADGALIAWKDESAYAAKHDNDPLFVGYDAVATKSFHGLADEFRLYRTALTPDAVRGLAWFLKGSNNVLLPRGVFFDSKLFQNLNDTTQMTSGPLAGATVHGNDNKGSAHLNARVIQMVITKNATLAQASQILTLARTNTTNVVTAFPLLAASEFYTLGLAKEVRDLAANVVVENSGNVSAPPPSPTLWQLFWNTVAGIAGAAWNAAMAVYQFFANVAKWLVDILIGLYKGLVENNWTYFQDNVLEPLRKALEAIVKFILELVTTALRQLIAPIMDPLVAPMRRDAETLVGRMPPEPSEAIDPEFRIQSHYVVMDAEAAWPFYAMMLGVFLLLAVMLLNVFINSMPFLALAITGIFVLIFSSYFVTPSLVGKGYGAAIEVSKRSWGSFFDSGTNFAASLVSALADTGRTVNGAIVVADTWAIAIGAFALAPAAAAAKFWGLAFATVGWLMVVSGLLIDMVLVTHSAPESTPLLALVAITMAVAGLVLAFAAIAEALAASGLERLGLLLAHGLLALFAVLALASGLAHYVGG